METQRIRFARMVRLQVIFFLLLVLGGMLGLLWPKNALGETVKPDSVANLEDDNSSAIAPLVFDAAPEESTPPPEEPVGEFDSPSVIDRAAVDVEPQSQKPSVVSTIEASEGNERVVSELESYSDAEALNLSAMDMPGEQTFPASFTLLYPTPKADGTFDPSFDISEYRGRFMNYTDVRSFFYDNPNFDLIDTRDLVETMAGECRKNEYSPGLFYSFNSKLIMYAYSRF